MNQLYLLAEVAGARFAIPAESVDSVVTCGEIVPVPLTPHPIAGLAALRSRVITVVDVLAAIGKGETAAGADHAIVIVTLDGHLYGLVVDEVHDVVEYDGEQMHVGAAFDAGWRRVSTGMVEVDGLAVVVLDPAALISPDRLAA